MLQVALNAVFAASMMAASVERPMDALQSYVGDWQCTWHAGGSSGQIEQVFAPVFGGAWLETREFVSVGGTQKLISLHYTGYDQRAKQYVHLGPDADGSYEIAHSPDGTTWSNDEGSFVFSRDGDDRRSMVAKAPTGEVMQTMSCDRVKH